MKHKRSNLQCVYLRNIRLGVVISLFLYWCTTVSVAANDNLFNGSDHLSPGTLVSHVLERNPDLHVTRLELQVAQERIGYAGSLNDPMVKYSVAPRTFSDSTIDGRHSIALSQRLPWFGKRQLRRDHARNQANASQENFHVTSLTLTESARIAFAQWYFIHAAMRINQHNQSLVEEFKQIAEIKFSAGKVSKQDVLQAELEILLLKKREIQLIREQQNTQAILNQLLNRPATAFIPEPDEIVVERNTVNTNIELQQILTQHPQLRQLERRIAAENSLVQLTDKEGYPDFTVNALYNGVMDPAEKRFQVGVSINIPFGEKITAKQREARAHLKQLEWQRQSLQNTLQVQFQQFLDQVHESQQLLLLYKDSLMPLAHENFITAKHDYETGRGDFLSLITAEKNLSQTQLAQERILADYYQRLAKLERVIGSTHKTDQSTLSDEIIISPHYTNGDS